MAIWLARLSVDRWRLSEGLKPGEGADGGPLALITETAQGPRIDAVNTFGAQAGARPGMMLADARTLCPHIQVALHSEKANLALLEKVALWARRWGPWSSLDLPDGVLVDVSGVDHLFGGEQRLLEDVQARFAARELTVSAAIAPTAGAAWALAHYGGDCRILGPGEDPKARLVGLPVAALQLDTDVLTVLKRLGLKQIGDLISVDRDALQRRFRNRKSPASSPLLRMDQLLGPLPEPLIPVLPLDVPMVQRHLLEPIRYRGLLNQVMNDLTLNMASLLEKRGKGARLLELGLWRVDGEVLTHRLELAAATRDADHIRRLFESRLDDVEAGFGIETVRLLANWSEQLSLEQDDIETIGEANGISRAACIDRLVVRLGETAVNRAVPHKSHLPEHAQRWQHPLTKEPISQGEFAFHARPLKLLDRVEKISVLYASPDGQPRSFRWRGEVHQVVRVEGPERIAPEWWRQRSSSRLRDYYRVEDRDGRRYWMYRHGLVDDGRGGMPDWYLQGLYA